MWQTVLFLHWFRDAVRNRASLTRNVDLVSQSSSVRSSGHVATRNGATGKAREPIRRPRGRTEWAATSRSLFLNRSVGKSWTSLQHKSPESSCSFHHDRLFGQHS